MTPTAEQAINLIRKLPPPEREKVREWIEGSNGDTPVRPNERQERFRRAMKWIDENRQQYLGMWVALDGDVLLASGSDGKAVRAEAAGKSTATPLMHLVTLSETQSFVGFE
ncbi:MAG: hypothetical protein AB7F88_09785 [Pyrinomonadaceae bacterium]